MNYLNFSNNIENLLERSNGITEAAIERKRKRERERENASNKLLEIN